MSLFAQIAASLVVAAVFGVLARLLRQPLLLAYILAGFVIVATGAVRIDDPRLLEHLGKIGVTFLLFLVGLEMNFSEIKSLGRPILSAGLFKIFSISILGFFVARLFGFSEIASFYIGICLAFPSTIIAVQILSEKKEIGSLHGKLAVGMLLVEDLVAILVLILLSGFAGGATFANFGLAIVKGVVIIAAVVALSKSILPKIFDRLAQSSEVLFVSSIAWALGIAAILGSRFVGFSTELGGFIAGLALANSVGHLQIASRVRPLRDFFLTIFFLVLGAELVLRGTGDILLPVLVFSTIVFLVSPLLIMIGLGFQGFSKRTSFMTAINFSQIFEFSLIVMAMGKSLGHIGGREVAIITFVGVVTVVLFASVSQRSREIYSFFQDFLGVFERKRTKEAALQEKDEFQNHIVLLGCDRTGRSILPALKRREEDLVVVDFNPTVVERLRADGYAALYGDVGDAETLELLNLGEAKLVISTVGSLEDNMVLLERLRGVKTRPATVVVALSNIDAIRLYELGADYVIVPQVVGGEHLSHLINIHGADKDFFAKLKNKHFDRLAKERYVV